MMHLPECNDKNMICVNENDYVEEIASVFSRGTFTIKDTSNVIATTEATDGMTIYTDDSKNNSRGKRNKNFWIHRTTCWKAKLLTLFNQSMNSSGGVGGTFAIVYDEFSCTQNNSPSPAA